MVTSAKLRQAEAMFITRRTSDTSRLSPILSAHEFPGELTMRIEKSACYPMQFPTTWRPTPAQCVAAR
jgi:hypothetical protein